MFSPSRLLSSPFRLSSWASLALFACTAANPEFRAEPVDGAHDSTSPGSRDASPAEPDAADAPIAPERPGDSGAPVDGPASGDMAPAAVNGLTGAYFVGLDFDSLAFSRIDPTINFAWVHAAPDSRLPEDDFSIRWTGEISPRHSERYTFHVDHDDGVRIWIGNTLLFDRWDSTGQDVQAEIDLTADQRYAIRIEHFDTVLTATMRLHWSSASQPREVVPASRLFTPPLP